LCRSKAKARRPTRARFQQLGRGGLFAAFVWVEKPLSGARLKQRLAIRHLPGHRARPSAANPLPSRAPVPWAAPRARFASFRQSGFAVSTAWALPVLDSGSGLVSGDTGLVNQERARPRPHSRISPCLRRGFTPIWKRAVSSRARLAARARSVVHSRSPQRARHKREQDLPSPVR